MADRRFGMVTDVRNMPSLSELAAAGITPLLNANDPGGFAAVQAAMQAAQNNAGLWIPADNRGVQEYVDWVKSWLNSIPSTQHVDLNIEAVGKGYPGSPGWDYTDQVLQQLEPWLQGRSWSASPMGMQDDFNYQAVVNRGGFIFPQAYQGDMAPLDPQSIFDWVRRNNIPADRIMPLLGSASQRGSRGHLYGIDLPGWQGQLGGLGMGSPFAEGGSPAPAAAPARPPSVAAATAAAPVFNEQSRGTRFVLAKPPPVQINTPRDFLRL